MAIQPCLLLLCAVVSHVSVTYM